MIFVVFLAGVLVGFLGMFIRVGYVIDGLLVVTEGKEMDRMQWEFNFRKQPGEIAKRKFVVLRVVKKKN